MQDRNCFLFRAGWIAVCTLTIVVALAPQLAAQAPGPDSLGFFKNYFVTGDYLVSGVGLRGLGDASGFAKGYIYVGVNDPNGVAHAGIPADAVPVAAFLYWETIESTATPSSSDAFFQGYPILGTPVGTGSSPCWSSGGGTGASNGSKVLRVYRADVSPNLVINGTFHTNGAYEVRVHDSGSNGAGTPLSEGASLVIVYRTLNAPLKSVVIYDGSWTMNNATSYMSQVVSGFYQADGSVPNSGRLTHIVGDGQSNFTEALYFNSTKLSDNPFTGTDGYSWDSTTYSVNVPDNASSILTYVVPNSSNIDCLSWGAVVFSTPVKDQDQDGLLDIWEDSQGYTDAKPGGQWVPLPGADKTKKDLYVQIDFLKNVGGTSGKAHSHLPKQDALTKIGTAFANAGGIAGAGVRVHFDVGGYFQGNQFVLPTTYTPPGATTAIPAAVGGNAIDEDAISCTDTSTMLCQFPYSTIQVPGIVSWKAGVTLAKNQYFPHGRKDSYRYVLVAHALGLPALNWSVADGSLVSISVSPQQVATVQTNTAHGLVPGTRVSISGAVGDYNLNGTYIVATTPTDTSFTVSTANVAVGSYSSVVFGYFPSQVLGEAVSGTTEQISEPNLLVSSGSPKSTSGFSDLGGADSLVTLGLWRADDPSGCQADPAGSLTGTQVYCNDQVGSATVQAGTIMHEMGHPLYLTHGGYYSNWQGGGPAFGQNCKPNFLSVMNYLFQIRGIPDSAGTIDPATGEVKANVDYSGQVLPELAETGLVEASGLGMAGGALPAYGTRYYGPPNVLDMIIQNTVGGRYASRHCDGSLPAQGEDPVVKLDAATVASGAVAKIDWNHDGDTLDTVANQDVNFDGDPKDAHLAGANDWTSLNLRQIGARRNFAGFSVDIQSTDILGGGAQTLGGGAQSLGGGAQTLGGGSDLINAGAQSLGGGAQTLGGGAQTLGGGAQSLGGGLEVDFDAANRTVDPPVRFVAVPGKKRVDLSWYPPTFGQIRAYNVWRAEVTKVPMSLNNPPVVIQKLTGATFGLSYTDFNVKTNSTYTYFITAELGSDSGSNSGNQSGPSNLQTVTVK